MTSKKLRTVVGITGASGAIYGFRLAQVLTQKGYPIYLIVTQAGRTVARHELGLDLGNSPHLQMPKSLVKYFGKGSRYVSWLDPFDMEAPVSSGSHQTKGMVVIPCSMGAVSGIAHGSSRDLVERAADVTLKEKRKLILVPRESPFSPIHLENLLTLGRLGAHVLPASPAFYQKPKAISDLVDFIVGRVLDLLEIEHELFKRWNSPKSL